MKPLLFIALDGLVKEYYKTMSIARELSQVDGNIGFKINLDFILFQGTNQIGPTLKVIRDALGKPVFFDLKMWNGSRTMISVAMELARLGVDYINVYALAGKSIYDVVMSVRGSNTKVLAVTVLTHYDKDYCHSYFRQDLGTVVLSHTKNAIRHHCHGVILPGTALKGVQEINVFKVVPGIRPLWYSDERHEQPVTPKFAVDNGADALVCGSPVMKNKDPVGALKSILSEI